MDQPHTPHAQSRRPRRGRLRRARRWAAIGLLALIAVVQAVPYGRSHDNPPVVAEPSWDSPRTRQLAVAACFDCHSNETDWPWYGNVAPVSWLVQRDVDEGRDALNFSEWGPAQSEEAGEAADVVEGGEMPPSTHRLLHGGARLSEREKDELVRGLIATFGERDERSARGSSS